MYTSRQHTGFKKLNKCSLDQLYQRGGMHKHFYEMPDTLKVSKILMMSREQQKGFQNSNAGPRQSKVEQLRMSRNKFLATM